MSTALTEAHRTSAARRGTKRTCEGDDCGRKFYDLNKAPMACPYCGAAFVERAAKPIDVSAYVPRQRVKHYKIEQAAPEADPVAADSELPAIEVEEEVDATDPNAAEIPEIEDEDLDEGIAGIVESDEA